MPKAAKKNSTTRKNTSANSDAARLAALSQKDCPSLPIMRQQNSDVVEAGATGFVLPVGILQQDSSIIDEQDDHLVLTIRISKEAIRNNHLLLKALSEACASR
jgi:hypothetical protein